jgi:L-lysine exporter family protein LysE/ArgO
LFAAFITGFLTQISLILALGPQNVFVLRQGLLRRHVFAICLFVTISDTILIWTGVIGFDTFSTFIPQISEFITLAGAIFLVGYGFLRFLAAYRGRYELKFVNNSETLKKSLLIIAGFTYLNPHVYLDTLGLIGAISTQYQFIGEKYTFAAGASLSSLLFFFSLGYGARIFTPIMQSTHAWRILDLLVGCTMLVIAGMLLSK